MEIKLIGNDDFMQLVELNAAMYKSIDSNINDFQATNTLLTLINTGKNFTAIGLYEDNVLMGLVHGFEIVPGEFNFTGLYVTTKNNEWTQKLIEYAFILIEERGYTAWEVEATNKNISSIMEKYGAKIKYTKYRKELKNG